MRGLGAYDRFGVIGDRDAGFGHHFEVVGAVADGAVLLALSAEVVGELAEFGGLASASTMFAEHAAVELAAFDVQSWRGCRRVQRSLSAR